MINSVRNDRTNGGEVPFYRPDKNGMAQPLGKLIQCGLDTVNLLMNRRKLDTARKKISVAEVRTAAINSRKP